MNDPLCDAWFDAVPASQRPVLSWLREVIFEVEPDAVEELKWSRPCYSAGGALFCYLHSTKKHATLGFQNGAMLPDPKQQLAGDGKEMRHIKLKTVDDIDELYLRGLLAAAISL